MAIAPRTRSTIPRVRLRAQKGGKGKAKGLKIEARRAYLPPEPSDGSRFLVDRLWPRGVKKEALRLDAWLKDMAPSEALRKGFCHDPAKWPEFKRRYARELDEKPEAWRPILEAARKGKVTLLFGAKDEEQNNAVALLEYLKQTNEEG